MTDAYRQNRLAAMRVLFDRATPTQRTTWAVLRVPGLYLSECVTAWWPWQCSEKERFKLAIEFNRQIHQRVELN